MSGLLVFEILNFTNFCYRDFRYYWNDNFIDVAINENLSRHNPYGERNKMYDSIAEFRSQNQNCCKVHYFDDIMEVRWFGRFIGINEFMVEIYYQISETVGSYKYYDSLVKMNSCKDVSHRMGMLEQRGPSP